MCHAVDRAEQRYNKSYTLKDIRQISNNIRNGKIVGESFKPKRDTGNLLAYTIYNHIPLKVLFNPVSYRIITMFPFDFDEYDKLQNKYKVVL